MIKNSENADSGIRDFLLTDRRSFLILGTRFEGGFMILEKCSAETRSYTQLFQEGEEPF